ncbi:ectoine/hydroxyectoine ABC transporter substrate-binding protein EhuB [Halomonas cerina]|uniref:Polar amino acid transport system substrate-binding protein n=1 Tax=Halomonas cerina TaxID=447424 RepID=A0A839V852_9GAMM|nr:ectoine/hydroxyectoine ABC transporter substrate-binding protein EhuB [Halomonas cerina]MBB3188897.1 polar amino acid transport system substrate-binding protein [Halomonas cerina]
MARSIPYPTGRLALAGLLLGLATLTTPLHAAPLEEIQERGVIRIAVANERPYGYLNAEGKALGVGPEVAHHLIDELGIERIEWLATDFDDLIPGLEEGRFDMAAAEMAIRPGRCERVLFSEPNTSYGEGLLVLASNPHQLDAYEDFAERTDSLKVAVQAGTVQEEIFDRLGVDPSRILTLEGPQEAIDALVRGQADAFAATGLTVSSLEEMSPEVQAEFNFKDPIVDGREVRYWGGFTFPLDADDLRAAVNDALKDYKRTDDWEQTLTRYGFLKKDILYSFRFDTRRLCGDQE